MNELNKKKFIYFGQEVESESGGGGGGQDDKQ